MKKVKGILIILLIFIIVNFLQINFFSWFTIRGIKPNLFILLILFLGLFTGKKIGSICGFIFGFIIDLLIGKSELKEVIIKKDNRLKKSMQKRLKNIT